MTTTVSAALTRSAAAAAWAWPLDLDRYRRHGWLCQAESVGLQMLGFELLRFDQDRTWQGWQAIRRLTAPLEDTQTALHWHPDNRYQRRFARDAAAIVLHHCAELGRAFWAWSIHEWATLLRPEHLRRRYPGQVGMSARPYLLAYAYLLTGFTAFELVGPFQRRSLAQKVFGAEAVEQAIEGIREVLTGWGYRANELESLVCTLLLLNGSPRLSELSTQVLAALRTNPAMQRHHHGRHLHGIHRALAALGHAGPPPEPKYGEGPAPITGTNAAWVQWVERWHATSTLQPTTRGIYRVVLAKIGRWLAAEHPHITEPGQWTRQTCAAWVAVVDRMTVGDHAQSAAWLDGHQGTIGKRCRRGRRLSGRRAWRW